MITRLRGGEITIRSRVRSFLNSNNKIQDPNPSLVKVLRVARATLKAFLGGAGIEEADEM